jgi:hypothetical protein
MMSKTLGGQLFYKQIIIFMLHATHDEQVFHGTQLELIINIKGGVQVALPSSCPSHHGNIFQISCAGGGQRQPPLLALLLTHMHTATNYACNIPKCVPFGLSYQPHGI